jgi:hypothetical protein
MILNPILESMEKHTQNIYVIMKEYFDNLYCDQNVPALWVLCLSKKLGIDWKPLSDDLSETASESD